MYYFYSLIVKNLFMAFGVGLTEFIFLKYIFVDNNIIIKRILTNIDNIRLIIKMTHLIKKIT